ncbi:MAG: hypothetical protein AAFP76_06330 [Bacteroidota bacterium]
MFQFFPLVVILQLFCLYHAHKNNADQKWYWLIIFFPLIGGLFYLYDHFYNRQNLQTVSEGFKGIINSNYEIEKLEQQLRATDSDQNKTLLADKYIEVGRYEDAVNLYESCLTGNNYDQTHVKKSLVYAHYLTGNYADSVKYAEQILDNKDFRKSEEKVGYAWSLYYMNEGAKAEEVFDEMDSSFTNYPQRLEYAKFLNERGSTSEAVSFLDKLIEEFGQMLPHERKDKRGSLRLIKSYKERLMKTK